MPDKNHKILNNLKIWKKPISIESLSGGITNINYLVEDSAEKKFVARFAPTSNKYLGLRRVYEVHNIRSIKRLHIGPSVIAYVPRMHLLIVNFLEGIVQNEESVKRSKILIGVAHTLKRIHTSKAKFRGIFNPFNTIRGYFKHVNKLKGWMPKDISSAIQMMEEIEQELWPIQCSTPCHLDLMVENVLEVGEKIKLLDWEYSASSDPSFDLGMFCMKADLNKEQEELLLKAYSVNKEMIKRVRLMKAVAALREAAWGVIQYSISSIPYDYKGYAEQHFLLFRKYYDENHS